MTTKMTAEHGENDNNDDGNDDDDDDDDGVETDSVTVTPRPPRKGSRLRR